ncbi:MAG: Gfo/Idh/MocA family protein [Candidatus Planktophila sp.]
MTQTRWGLIGAGWIATKAIAPAMHAASDTIIQAVASRDLDRAEALNPVTAYESYEALISDPLVDAVYISLPNHLHCQWTVAALNAGKHVLCEKPFAMNVAEIEFMILAARDNDRLLVEAVWSRWHPRMIRMIDYVKAGNIGDIVSIDASFTFPAKIDENYRAQSAMGGGALYDVGVYPLHAIAALIGDDAQVEIESCNVNMGPTGVDLTTKWQMRIDGSITANVLASFEMPENQSLIVRGEKESLELVGTDAFTSWHSASTLRLGKQSENFEATDPYMLMIENFGKRIQAQESWVLPLETSVSVAEVLEQIQNSN